MRAIQFYQEFSDTDKREPTGNVVVVYPQTRHFFGDQVVYEGLGRCFPNVLASEQTAILPNQPVTNWKVDTAWLQQHCKLISEKQARLIHPYLFESYMDGELLERRKEERKQVGMTLGLASLVLAFVYGYHLSTRLSRLRESLQ